MLINVFESVKCAIECILIDYQITSDTGRIFLGFSMRQMQALELETENIVIQRCTLIPVFLDKVKAKIDDWDIFGIGYDTPD